MNGNITTEEEFFDKLRIEFDGEEDVIPIPPNLSELVAVIISALTPTEIVAAGLIAVWRLTLVILSALALIFLIYYTAAGLLSWNPVGK